MNLTKYAKEYFRNLAKIAEKAGMLKDGKPTYDFNKILRENLKTPLYHPDPEKAAELLNTPPDQLIHSKNSTPSTLV